MYVKVKNRLIKEVDFSASDENVFEYQGRVYSHVMDLLDALGDDELARSFIDVLFSYLNRHNKIPEFNISDLDSSDGYEIQWGLEKVEKETGLKISYFGVVYSREFDGFTDSIPSGDCNVREYIPIPSMKP